MEAEDDRRLHCSRAPLMGAHESLDVGIAAGAVSTTMVVGLIDRGIDRRQPVLPKDRSERTRILSCQHACNGEVIKAHYEQYEPE